MNRGQPGSWHREFNDFIRSITGALLFGIPLIYTMEMWWIATYLSTDKLLLYLAFAFVIDLYLAKLIGLKRGARFGAVLGEAVRNLGTGVIASAFLMFVLNRISIGDPFELILSEIALQAVPLSIGAAVTRAATEENTERTHPDAPITWQNIFAHIGVTAAGALFLSFAVAPIEEVQKLEAETTHWHHLAIIVVSLLLTYTIVYRSGLSPGWGSGIGGDAFHWPLADTVMVYTISLLIGLASLYLFGQIDVGDPYEYIVSQGIVIGLPSTLGGAAARHLV